MGSVGSVRGVSWDLPLTNLFLVIVRFAIIPRARVGYEMIDRQQGV